MVPMPEAHERRSVVEEAEQAAAAGDYSRAEQLLREAALLQEANLGPLHPDLANTLNNLGVVCEIVDNPADAELCYRRACAIATEVLEPDHPFVATSRKNLSDFCEARGKLVESPPPTVAGRGPHATSSAHVPRKRPSRSKRVPSSSRWSRPLAIGAVTASALVFAMLTVIRPWFSSTGWAGSSSRGPSQSSSGSPAPPLAAEPLPVEPVSAPNETTTNSHGAVGVEAKADPVPNAAATTPAGRPAREPASVPSSAAESQATATSALTSPLVADAHLCRNLSTVLSRGSPNDWQCDPVSLPVGQGSLFFYTRLKSENDTTVQHRWYRGDRLQQVVELRIRANPSSGFRTYSRSTVDNLSGGDWRVELRTNEGILLHEEHFVVR